MSIRPLVPFFEIYLKKSELKTTHNTFRDCRVHFFRQFFSKQLYNLSYQLTINLQVVIQLYVAVANGVVASQQDFY